MRGMRVLVPLVLSTTAVIAQQSESYRLTEYALNAGGDPSQGIVLASKSFEITLGSIGDPLAKRELASAAFGMDAGFVVGYPPPGEVLGLSFSNKTTLAWNPEQSVGEYNLYRDLISSVAGLGYGACEQQALPLATTTDDDEPPASDGFFYLVTAENRLSEEGTKGRSSAGGERQGGVCP